VGPALDQQAAFIHQTTQAGLLCPNTGFVAQQAALNDEQPSRFLSRH